jgi:Integrase core domain
MRSGDRPPPGTKVGMIVQVLAPAVQHRDEADLGPQMFGIGGDHAQRLGRCLEQDGAGKMEGAAFLRNVVEVFPYKIHIVLTDNGMAFADLPKNREGASRRFLGPHIFDRVCIANGIEHRLTKPYHPWTNGQAERMNRTIKDATVKVFHYDDLESLKTHVLAFVTAHNFARHLKALRWRTPFQAICDAWTKEPSIFKINPHHFIPGPHN